MKDWKSEQTRSFQRDDDPTAAWVEGAARADSTGGKCYLDSSKFPTLDDVIRRAEASSAAATTDAPAAPAPATPALVLWCCNRQAA